MQRKGFSFEGQKIFAGIDVHLKTWSVAVMTRAGSMETFSQESDACVLFTHLSNKYPGGTYYSIYESGFCGFSVHYLLMELGIKNITVNAADVPTTQKEALMKTDKIDAAKLARALEAGLPDPVFVP